MNLRNFFIFLILLKFSLLNGKIITILSNNSFSPTVFYIIEKNNTIPSSCFISVYPLNISLNQCFGFFSIENYSEKIKIFANYYLNNKTFQEQKIIKLPIIFSYKIVPKELILNGNNVIVVKTNFSGFLKIGKDYFLLKPGENKIKITKFYPKGELDIEIKLCKGKNCKIFKDFLIIKPSPAYCEIKIIENKFPNYLKFNLTIKDQEFKKYYPKILYFDMDIFPYLVGESYFIKFPIFYPSQNFSIKIIADGRVCEKKVNLNYSNYFYSFSTIFQKEINISEVFLKNPFEGTYNISLKYFKDNKSYILNLTLGKEIIKLKLPFSDYYVIYKNKTIYSFEPKIIENKELERKITLIGNVILIFVLLIIIFFIIVYFLL